MSDWWRVNVSAWVSAETEAEAQRRAVALINPEVFPHPGLKQEDPGRFLIDGLAVTVHAAVKTETRVKPGMLGRLLRAMRWGAA